MSYQMLINGKLHAGSSALAVINPALETAFAEAPLADRALVETALDAGVRAFPAWSALRFDERGDYMRKWADAIEARMVEFGRLLTQEQGKPLDQAMYEMGGTVACLRYYAGQSLSDRLVREDEATRVIEHRTPLGLVAGITPWNFPMMLLMLKIGPALITGNTIIAKPAPTTPLTTMLLGQLAAEIFPAGVFQTLLTGNELASLLTTDPRVACVSFTGSTPTGRKVYAAGADTLKRFTLELGGNDAAIVLDDVDAASVAQGIYNAATLNAGQVCMAAKRIYAPRAIHDELVDALGALADAAIVGDGLDQGTQVGPIQNELQYQKLIGFYNEAAAKGRIAGGQGILDRKGYFVHPTIVADMPDDSRLVREEQFGPILPVLPYDTLDEALQRANDSIYGLAGSVWTSDPQRGEEVARRLDTGTTWVNRHMDLPFDVEFGGCKQSGIGRQQGIQGLEDLTQPKIVNVNKTAGFPPRGQQPGQDRATAPRAAGKATAASQKKSVIARIFSRNP